MLHDLSFQDNVGKYSSSKKKIKHIVGIRVVLGVMHHCNFIVGIRDEQKGAILISNVVTPMTLSFKETLSTFSPLYLPKIVGCVSHWELFIMPGKT